eukprot:Rhum_TRINITY_DN10001_c0_g2::Rhum_TRINITY_DN10001_c0_g2_i1::g.36368::m.36368/K07759/PARG; poly(ADP-ribose) glycohydrolase
MRRKSSCLEDYGFLPKAKSPRTQKRDSKQAPALTKDPLSFRGMFSKRPPPRQEPPAVVNDLTLESSSSLTESASAAEDLGTLIASTAPPYVYTDVDAEDDADAAAAAAAAAASTTPPQKRSSPARQRSPAAAAVAAPPPATLRVAVPRYYDASTQQGRSYHFLCRYHMTGVCKRGAACEYLHCASAPLEPHSYLILINHYKHEWDSYVAPELNHLLGRLAKRVSQLEPHGAPGNAPRYAEMAMELCRVVDQFSYLTGSDLHRGEYRPPHERLPFLRGFADPAMAARGGALREEEAREFYGEVLPFMVRLVLETDGILSGAVPLLRRVENEGKAVDAHVDMNEAQVAALLAHCFFCLVPHRHQRSYPKPLSVTNTDREYFNRVSHGYPSCNFLPLYAESCRHHKADAPAPVVPVNFQKLRCLHHYFVKAHARLRGVALDNPGAMPDHIDNFRVTRHSLAPANVPDWKHCAAALCPVEVMEAGEVIEEAGGCLQVDFANKKIGGGVLGRGCVQEEIRFLVSPQLIVTRLVCEEMGPLEAIKMFGARQYSAYTGYGETFAWAGDYADCNRTTADRIPEVSITAADAVNFTRRGLSPAMQYQAEFVKREVGKAYVAFRRSAVDGIPVGAVATGRWGCGVFGGDTQLKALLQLCAASAAGVPLMRFYAYDDASIGPQLTLFSQLLSAKGCDVRSVFRAISSYSPSSGASVFGHVVAVLGLEDPGVPGA